MTIKPRIVWLHSHTLFSTGGTRFIFEVLIRLTNKYEIVLIVEKTSKEWREKFESNHIEVKEISNYTSNSLFYWSFFTLFIFVDFIKIKKIIRPNDILISSMFPFNFIGSLFSNKHIYYCFEPFAFFYDQPLMRQAGLLKYCLHKILKSFYVKLDQVGTKKANKVLAINPSVGKHIKHIYNVTPNDYTFLGVDFSHFKPIKIKKSNITTFFHSTDYTILKGTQYLLLSLKYLKPYINKFRIIISDSITNSRTKNYFIKEIEQLGFSKNIFFVGHIPYSELPKYYSISDFYLFLGSPDSQGATAASLSVLEAQSCGLPVLRSVGNSDEVINGETGFLIDPRQYQKLAEKMLYILDNKKITRKMSRNCIQHIKDRYTWENVSQIFIKSIESLR